jgi:hypothetical protein
MNDYEATSAADSGSYDRDLPQQLVDLLDKARARLASFFEVRGLAPTVAEQRMAVIANDEGTGWHGEYLSTAVNALSLRAPVVFPEVLSGWLGEVRATAAAVAQRHPVGALPRTAFPPPGLDLVGLSEEDLDEDDPAQRVLGLIVCATRWYLTHIPSIATADHGSAQTIASDLLTLLATGKWRARQSVAILGVRPERDLLECDGNRLKLLSPLERGEFLNFGWRSSGMGLPRVRPMMVCPSHVLEMDQEVGSPNEMGQLPSPLLMALRLHQIDFAGPGLVVTELLPQCLSFGYASKPVPMPTNMGGLCAITDAQFAEACSTAKLLSPYPFEHPNRSSELALHRFGLGCGRDDAADGLLDFVIALEALLLPYDRKVRFSDLSYRFRLHGAHFIASSRQEIRGVFRTLDKLYDIRSRLVHGSDYPGRDEILAGAREARGLAARGLLKAVRRGFPNAEEFNRLALGEIPTEL